MLFEVLVTVVVLVVSVRVWYLTTSGRCYYTRSMKGKTVIVTGGSAGSCLDRSAQDNRITEACVGVGGKGWLVWCLSYLQRQLDIQPDIKY
ncbi:hypothetical protein Pcinc_006140 [Petrolisthes cinctipes]|uniref:Uncharacterized protein n=1 Tax=Petrolisthes cinctipes TaxID=88211 RepID=A0AAE1GHY6_PETCI|nr:hypothetical protein Pcinc_006140 [Petrolisthes cinctipes]